MYIFCLKRRPLIIAEILHERSLLSYVFRRLFKMRRMGPADQVRMANLGDKNVRTNSQPRCVKPLWTKLMVLRSQKEQNKIIIRKELIHSLYSVKMCSRCI